MPDTSPASVQARAQVFAEDLDDPVVADEDRAHLGDVLRLRTGEVVVVCDGRGRWRTSRYSVATQRGALCEPRLVPDGPVVVEDPPHPEVTVAFVPVKGDRPEWAVQKLTEAGVDRIVVLRSGRSVVRWEGERGARAVERLGRVARQAAAQSRRSRVPVVSGVATLDEAAAAVSPVPLALAHPGGAPPAAAFPAVAVGPEGGWDPAEVQVGMPLVGLGPRVLRAETAAVAVGLLLCALRDGLVAPAVPHHRDPGPGMSGA